MIRENKGVEISFDRIEVNKNLLPNFNVLSTLEFYNVGLNEFEILKDESVCNNCPINYYLDGNLSFNVSDFEGTYSVRAKTIVPPTNGEGGNDGSSSGGDPFTLEKDEIFVSLREGEGLVGGCKQGLGYRV